MRLHSETNVDILQQAVKLLEHENNKLVAQNVKMMEELLALKGGDPEQIKLRLAELEQQLALRNKLLFGDSSEMRGRSQDKRKTKKKQRGHGPKPQPKLRIVEQTHQLDEADRQCKLCGGELAAWKEQFEESEHLTEAISWCLDNLDKISGDPCTQSASHYSPAAVLEPVYENYRRLAAI